MFSRDVRLNAQRTRWDLIFWTFPHNFFFFYQILVVDPHNGGGWAKIWKLFFIFLPLSFIACIYNWECHWTNLYFYFCLPLPKFLNEFTIRNAQQQTCACNSFLHYGLFINVQLTTDELYSIWLYSLHISSLSIWKSRKCHRMILFFISFFLDSLCMNLQLGMSQDKRKHQTFDLSRKIHDR